MITEEVLNQAVELLLSNSPSGSKVILFGSQARHTATDESDADFLVIEPEVTNRYEEMVRLRKVLRSLRIPVDILVVSRSVFENWKEIPNTVIYQAAKEGKRFGFAA